MREIIGDAESQKDDTTSVMKDFKLIQANQGTANEGQSTVANKYLHQRNSVNPWLKMITLTDKISNDTFRRHKVYMKCIRDVKYHICNYSNCNKEFKKPSDLLRHLRVHTNDKPWIDSEFKQTIRMRQYAKKTGDILTYKKMRNKVNRMNSSLKRKYYKRSVERLKKSDARNWWRHTKQLSGMKQDRIMRIHRMR